MKSYTSTHPFCFLLLPCLFVIVFQSQLFAQDKSDYSAAFGISAAHTNIPEEAAFKDVGGEGEIDKFELFLDYYRVRLGFNAMHGLREESSPKTVLASNTAYLAYRFLAYDYASNSDAYMLAGLALVHAHLKIGENDGYNSDDYGYVFGLGALYYFSGSLGIGGQFLRISAVGNLNDEKIETGSDQIQFVFKFPF